MSVAPEPRLSAQLHQPDFRALADGMMEIEAVLHRWPLIRVLNFSMWPTVTPALGTFRGARGGVHFTRDHHPAQLEFLGWLTSIGGVVERPIRPNDPDEDWQVCWRGWRFFSGVPIRIPLERLPPRSELFHDFPDGPGPHACRRPGCSAGSGLPSARTPCGLPEHLAIALDRQDAGPERAA